MVGLRPKTGLAHPTSDSDIEIADVERMLLDEIAAGFDVVAHQHTEDFIRGGPNFLQVNTCSRDQLPLE
jgi:hypothetical protein